jgi:hypothetical protein
MQAETLVSILTGRADVAEAGGGQEAGEEVPKESLGALFHEMRRSDYAGLGYVADWRAFVRGPSDVERAPGENGELEAGSCLDVDRFDSSRQTRTQLAGAGAGNLGYLPYPAGEILFANGASVKLHQDLSPCSLICPASNGLAVAAFYTAIRRGV